MLSKTSVGIAAGAAALGFIGYCVYFDHKRRSDPLFKQKLRERRKKAKEAKKLAESSNIPDLTDHEKRQQFFIQEVHLGEELIGKGYLQEGVEHLATATAVCGEPQRLLTLFQQTLPPQVFQMVTQALPVVSERLAEKMLPPASAGMPIGMMEEDLE